jgi:hypothetical protein
MRIEQPAGQKAVLYDGGADYWDVIAGTGDYREYLLRGEQFLRESMLYLQQLEPPDQTFYTELRKRLCNIVPARKNMTRGEEDNDGKIE